MDRPPRRPPTTGLLDTSVLIASKSGRPLRADLIPEESAVCVVTIAELHAGVLAALDTHTRARRLATLKAVSVFSALPIDAEVAASWALLRVRLAEAGRRMKVNDLWIAATAASNSLAIVTQDDDFAALESIDGPEVIRV